MNEYTIIAVGVRGTEFVYTALARTPMLAACEAYGEHGQRLRSGELQEPLGPKHEIIVHSI